MISVQLESGHHDALDELVLLADSLAKAQHVVDLQRRLIALPDANVVHKGPVRAGVLHQPGALHMVRLLRKW